MTNISLAQSYLIKAKKRLKILDVLMSEAAYSDAIREAQEIVELALKGMLRHVGIEPPHWRDVGGLLPEHRDRFPEPVLAHIEEAAAISKWLRKERELSCSGDLDFIPTEEYTVEDARKAIEGTILAVRLAEAVIPWPER